MTGGRTPVVPEGALIEVAMTIRLPRAAAPEHIDAWLKLNIGGFGSIEIENPLSQDEPESWGFRPPEWRDTGLTGRVIESPHVKQPDGSEHYTRRYLAEERS